MESMTDSMVVDSSTMGVSMVDMEGMEVGIRGREFSWRGEEAEGNLADLASLSIVITFADDIGQCGSSLIILDLESALKTQNVMEIVGISNILLASPLGHP